MAASWAGRSCASGPARTWSSVSARSAIVVGEALTAGILASSVARLMPGGAMRLDGRADETPRHHGHGDEPEQPHEDQDRAHQLSLEVVLRGSTSPNDKIR